jgi:hypothetical protein
MTLSISRHADLQGPRERPDESSRKQNADGRLVSVKTFEGREMLRLPGGKRRRERNGAWDDPRGRCAGEMRWMGGLLIGLGGTSALQRLGP